MARSQALLRVGLALVLVGGCAGTGTNTVGQATARMTTGAQSPAPSASPFEPYPSQDYVEPEVPSPTAVPDPELVITGIDTDQPCTASVADAPPAALGIGLEDVPAMVSEDDLREAVARVKVGKGREWVVSSGFQDNVSLSDWRNSFTWPEACDPFVEFGRVTGFTAEASTSCTTDECWEDEGDTDELPKRVWASVHLLQTEAGARAFLEWLSPQLWDALLGQCPWCEMNEELEARGTPNVSQMHQDGVKVTKVTGSANIGDAQMVLVRQGRVVAEVLVAGPPDGLPGVNADALALKMAAAIASTPADPNPYDITQVMSAPLRAESMPAISNVEDCAPAPACPPVEFTGGGGSDNAAFMYDMGGREEKATDHINRYGRSVRYSAAYTLPPGRSVETSFTQYASEAAARSAQADLASKGMAGGFPNEWGSDNSPSLHGLFEIPGLDHAVGVTIALDHQGGMAISPHWIIYFPHGPGLATIRVSGDVFHEDDGEAYLDPFSSDKSQPGAFDGETLAIELARTFDDRLDRILG